MTSTTDYRLLSPQQLAKLFTALPSQGLHLFAGMFSDSTIVAISRYMSAGAIASLSPKLPISDVVRVIPQLDKAKVIDIFALTPQSFNEDVIANLDYDYVLEMFQLVPRPLNLRTFNNFNLAKAASISHLFDDIEAHFPETGSRINLLRRQCAATPSRRTVTSGSRTTTTTVAYDDEQPGQLKIHF